MLIKLKKINVLKMGCIFALLYSLLSLIIFIAGALFAGIMGQTFPWFMIILGPILYAIGGFIGGLIMGGLYNLVSKWIGGLEFEVEETKKFSE